MNAKLLSLKVISSNHVTWQIYHHYYLAFFPLPLQLHNISCLKLIVILMEEDQFNEFKYEKV